MNKKSKLILTICSCLIEFIVLTLYLTIFQNLYNNAILNNDYNFVHLDYILSTLIGVLTIIVIHFNTIIWINLKIKASNIFILILTILNSIVLFLEIRYFMLIKITSDIIWDFNIVLQFILIPLLLVTTNIILWLPKQTLTSEQKKELKRQKLEAQLKQLK